MTRGTTRSQHSPNPSVTIGGDRRYDRYDNRRDDHRGYDDRRGGGYGGGGGDRHYDKRRNYRRGVKTGTKDCLYGKGCTRKGCSFNHPGLQDCKYGEKCYRNDCWYNHPSGCAPPHSNSSSTCNGAPSFPPPPPPFTGTRGAPSFPPPPPPPQPNSPFTGTNSAPLPVEAKDEMEALRILALDESMNWDWDKIRKTYHKLALQYHPDKGGTDAMFQKINSAYETLKNWKNTPSL